MIFNLDKWDENNYLKFVEYIKSIEDVKHKEFHKKLVPGITKCLGIKIPKLREISKSISKGNWKEFLEISKEDFYEEVMVQGMVIGNIKSEFDEIEFYLERFLPKINNWAVCDTFCCGLKQTKKYKKEMLNIIDKHIKSNNPWEIRFAVVMLIAHYVEEENIDTIFCYIDNLISEEYYVKMAIAWLVSVCFVKFRERTLVYLIDSPLDNFTYNKSLQKIIESNRVSKEDKVIIKGMKRKG